MVFAPICKPLYLGGSNNRKGWPECEGDAEADRRRHQAPGTGQSQICQRVFIFTINQMFHLLLSLLGQCFYCRTLLFIVPQIKLISCQCGETLHLENLQVSTTVIAAKYFICTVSVPYRSFQVCGSEYKNFPLKNITRQFFYIVGQGCGSWPLLL